MCAKTTDGVSLTELVKTTDYDGGTGETIEYKLWCKMHNPVSGHDPCGRSIHRSSQPDYLPMVIPRRTFLRLAERQKLPSKQYSIGNLRPPSLVQLFRINIQPVDAGMYRLRGK